MTTASRSPRPSTPSARRTRRDVTDGRADTGASGFSGPHAIVWTYCATMVVTATVMTTGLHHVEPDLRAVLLMIVIWIIACPIVLFHSMVMWADATRKAWRDRQACLKETMALAALTLAHLPAAMHQPFGTLLAIMLVPATLPAPIVAPLVAWRLLLPSRPEGGRP